MPITGVSIRPIAPEDAGRVEELYAQSAAHLRSLGDQTNFGFSAAAFRRDGFGDHPAFQGIVAVLDDNPVGYLLYTLGYDTDAAKRFLFVIDLAVDASMRRRGIGEALMTEAASICRHASGGLMFWVVYAKNELALNFYRRLGAEPIATGVFMTLAV